MRAARRRRRAGERARSSDSAIAPRPRVEVDPVPGEEMVDHIEVRLARPSISHDAAVLDDEARARGRSGRPWRRGRARDRARSSSSRRRSRRSRETNRSDLRAFPGKEPPLAYTAFASRTNAAVSGASHSDSSRAAQASSSSADERSRPQRCVDRRGSSRPGTLASSAARARLSASCERPATQRDRRLAAERLRRRAEVVRGRCAPSRTASSVTSSSRMAGRSEDELRPLPRRAGSRRPGRTPSLQSLK